MSREVSVQDLQTVVQSCKGCQFGVMDGKTQTGCSFGRLDKYREQNPDSVIEAFDEDEEFFLVNGRRCAAFRPRGGGATKEKVRKEIAVRVGVLLLIGSPFTDEELERTARSIKDQDPPVACVHAVLNCATPPGDVLPLLRQHFDGTGIEWALTHVRERNEDGSFVSRGRAIDQAVPKIKASFYSVWSPGSTLPPNLTSCIDGRVTDGLARFCAVRARPDGEGETVATGLHQSPVMGGNRPIWAEDPLATQIEPHPDADTRKVYLDGILAKAEHAAAANNTPWLLTDLEELCRPL